MDEKKRFISLKTKIMISTLIPVVVSFVLISSVIFLSLFESLQETAKAEVLQISQKHAHSFENKINSAMNYLSIIANELEIRVETAPTDREALQKTILNIFDEYKLIDGSSVYFEPGMYDGKDAHYIGSEYGTAKSGRICWYFYKDDGKIAYLPEGLEGDIEFELPHYTEAKKANKPIFTDPVVHEIDGRSIPMFTLTYPILDNNDQFIGAVTVDLFLDDIYTQLHNEKIYETGYIIIANDNGRIIYSPRYEDTAKTVEEAGLDYELPSGDGASAFFNARSILNGSDTLAIINTIHIPQLDSDFYISVAAPLNEINADATRLIILFAIFAMFVVTAIALLLYYLIGKLSAPLNEITESVDKIANGDYNARIKGAYKGEFAVVKDSVNTMADSIEAYIKESSSSMDVLKNILNGLEAVIYVSDPVTDEILFVNDSMKKLFNLGDNVTGLICWKTFQLNFEKKCDFCPCYQLDKNPTKPIIWEEHNTVTQHYYRNTDRYIDWIDGRKVHLQHSVDMTDIKMTQFTLDRRLEQQAIMTSISQSFLSDADTDALITNALRMIGEFMGVAQILFFKLDEDSVALTCQTEWLNPDLALQTRIGDKLVLQGPALSDIKRMSEENRLCLNSNDPFLKTAMAPYRVNFQNYITTPIFLEGSMYGALDFSREDDGKEWSESEIHLATFVSSLLIGVLERHCMELELITAKELAEQGSRAKSEFLSRMSHEMRTPMNAIIGMTNIAKSSYDSEKKDHCLEKIDDASKHLLGVINDILDMSKIEANKFELSSIEFNFEKMLQKVVNVNNFRICEKKQDFTIYIDENIPRTLIGDDQRLAQVITNILSNAVKFTPEGGSLGLNAHLLKEEDGVCTLQIDITDTGIGIGEEQQSRIFNSFEQAENSTSRKFGGTGLGLPISKSIIEMMDGRIWIESEPGKGSTFSFTIQAQRGNAELSGANAMPLEKDALAEEVDRFEGYCVLLAEDVEINQEIVIAMLEPTSLTIDCAENGLEAVKLFGEAPERYDLIFMDMQMPEMDGCEATRKIRALDIPKANSIPIIAMTANVFREDVEKCLAAGMNDHLGKPIDFNELLNKLRTYLYIGMAPTE